MPVFLVSGRGFDEKEVFKRVVYAKDRAESVGAALHEANRERGFEDRLQRSKMYYSVKTLVDFVPGLDSEEEEGSMAPTSSEPSEEVEPGKLDYGE